MRCRFDDDFPVVAKVKLSDGCRCYPDDHEQLLCAQHLNDCDPFGTVEVIEAYRWPALTNREAWRRRMAECDHPLVEVVNIEGRDYGICKECLWFMPGRVARDLQGK